MACCPEPVCCVPVRRALADRFGRFLGRRSGPNLVKKWLGRFRSRGLRGLDDMPRSGRPQKIQCLERTQVVAAACQAPEQYGLQRVLWSHSALSEAVVESGLVRSISARTVGRTLRQAQIKPHRVKMWCHSEDPRFQEKLRDIVRLYMAAPVREPVLCVDERSGMQALSRARGLIGPQVGRWGRLEYEYKRHGTRCLFTCFNVRTGRVLGRCHRYRKRADFLSFMDLVAAHYRQKRVHVVLDNLNTHRDTSAGAFISESNRALVFDPEPSGASLRKLRSGSGSGREGGGFHRAVERAGSPSLPLDL